ncbi:FapA family protein [Desulfobacula sp.]|uniref:FapA family protein n=1 Tax=Desulfobacula sp. TaxID=2593537 RepID=UPI00261652BD|nr:FapA family protein [Desulfobacula sp.]
MEQQNQIPSLAELALQYGTINNEQFAYIHGLSAPNAKQDNKIGFDHLLLHHGIATGYQVGLLKLIQEYLIIRKRGEAFGKIAIEKGFAAPEDVIKALEHQKKEFKRAKIKRLIGDILVESRVLTIKQKNVVLNEQISLNIQAEKIFVLDESDQTGSDEDRFIENGIPLSTYEKQFLKIKGLDQKFAQRIIEKGFSSKRQVKIVQKVQEEAFEKAHTIRILADIMIEFKYLTTDQKNRVIKEQDRIEKNGGGLTIPGVHVRICKDQMVATIHISKDLADVRLADIKQALDSMGIQYGIYPDAVLQCNLDLGNDSFVAANQGFSLENLEHATPVYHFDSDKKEVKVKKGAPLAEVHFGGDAYFGKDLFGNRVEHLNGKTLRFRCASGARLSRDDTKALADKTGIPSLSIERKLYVHSLINILEDADLKYGPIESYANLTVSGVLTGAYPVTAGQINAREIRGASIDALGCVRSHIGITDAVIRTQGDVHARYLHHCRIEAFGNVYIENEIIDCQILCSGKIDSGHCRVISSILYAKKGIELAGAGSNRTKACILGAGSEHHLLEKVRQIDFEIKKITQPLDELQEKRDEKDRYAKKLFRKMIELKIFHDRAKNKKQKLANEFKSRKKAFTKKELKNLVALISNFDNKMTSSISSLKILNEKKKECEREKKIIKIKIETLSPKINTAVSGLQMDKFLFVEWTRQQENIPQIKINHKLFPGTILKGIFSSLKIEKDVNNFLAVERHPSTADGQMVIQKF